MGRTANWRTILLLLTLVITASTTALLAADNGAISGVVSQSSGQPAPGAFVQAKNVDKGITTTVISQDQGRFTVPNLGPGKYVVRASGGGMKSETKDPVTLGAGQKLTVNVALATDQTFREASTQALELSLLPDGEKEKKFIDGTCGLCHKFGFQEILFSRRDRDGWMDILSIMRNHPFGNRLTVNMTDQERDMLVNYFMKGLTPDVPPFDQKANLPRKWVTGAATKAVIVEFDLAKNAYPHDIDVDAKGVVWVSERDLGYIGRLDPATFEYTRYKVPVTEEKLQYPAFAGQTVQLADALSVDAKGHVWVVDTEASTLYEFNPETKSFNSFVHKGEDGQPDTGNKRLSANTIRFLADGSVWFTNGGGKNVTKFDPATKKFTVYPAMMSSTKGGPYGLGVDGAGNLWFPEQLGNQVGQLDPETGKVTQHDPPTANDVPRRMGMDWDGNPWFAEFGAGNLVKIDFHTGNMTEYPAPTKYSAPYSVDSDKLSKTIWVNENYADQMAKFDPSTKTWVEYSLPEHHNSVRKIAVDPTRPNRVWFGEPAKDRVAYIELLK